MSDLLPLLAATLRDKVVLDAQAEIEALRSAAELVQIVHSPKDLQESTENTDVGNGGNEDREAEEMGEEEREEIDDIETTVYASGNIKDGFYSQSNDIYWEISFATKKTCLLRNLRHCRVYAGGGFEIASILDSEFPGYYQIVLDPDEEDGSDSKVFRICFSFPETMWLKFVIKDWPTWRQEFDQIFEADNWDFEEGIFGIRYLCDHVAAETPDAKVEFQSIMMQPNALSPAMKLYIPREVRHQARSLRDERRRMIEAEGATTVPEFATARFRAYYDASREGRDLDDFLSLLGPLELRRMPGTDIPDSGSMVLIDRLAIVYNYQGREEAEEIITQLLQARVEEND